MGAEEKFWQLDTAAEMRLVDELLNRRFPLTYRAIRAALEEADPLEVVYPGNPGEYNDAVREIVTLLAPVNADLELLSRAQVGEVVRKGLARCFGEPPDEDRLRNAIELISSRSGRHR